MIRSGIALGTVLLMSSLPFNAMARGGSDEIRMDPVEVSYTYLAREASAFGLQSVRDELVVKDVLTDRLGMTHVRMEHRYRGIPVFGEQLITHIDREGRVFYVSGAATPLANLSIRPDLNVFEALDIARADFERWPSEVPTTELTILTFEQDEPHLTWRVEVKDLESDDPSAWVYFIDAHTGDIVLDYDNLQTAPAKGVGRTLYSGDVAISTNSVAGGYEMLDSTRGGLQTNDMMNGSAGNGQIFTDNDNVWGNGKNNDRASAAADAHYGAQMTWDYYKNVYGRNGLHDDGEGTLSRVHYGNNYVNAFWDDGCFCMTYGDGDGQVSDPLTALDVAGHEMTHGLTSATAGLIYTKQPGALNESMSDIFGTAVEFYAAGIDGSDEPEYWIGESFWTPSVPNDALRYMDDPTKDGISIDNANRYRPFMDVHYTSGVSNNVFYLASEGGRNKTSGIQVAPIGREKAEAIFYRALTVYMTPITNWAKARDYTVQAALDLYSQAEADGISEAWRACGVN